MCGVNVPWKVLEPIEGELNWQPFEALLAWAESQGLPVLAGPLLDFSGYGIPDWLWGKDLDLTLLCDFLCEFVERTVAATRAASSTGTSWPAATWPASWPAAKTNCSG